MRLVIDLIRGKSAAQALAILRFNTKLASRDAEMVLRSAVANLSNTPEGRSFDPDEVKVKAAWVDQGPSMKRILPAPMGRAYRVKKRSNHLTIVVETLENK
jgi:large subunit ribosomal protein L22